MAVHTNTPSFRPQPSILRDLPPSLRHIRCVVDFDPFSAALPLPSPISRRLSQLAVFLLQRCLGGLKQRGLPGQQTSSGQRGVFFSERQGCFKFTSGFILQQPYVHTQRLVPRFDTSDSTPALSFWPRGTAALPGLGEHVWSEGHRQLLYGPIPVPASFHRTNALQKTPNSTETREASAKHVSAACTLTSAAACIRQRRSVKRLEALADSWLLVTPQDRLDRRAEPLFVAAKLPAVLPPRATRGFFLHSKLFVRFALLFILYLTWGFPR